MRTRALLLTVIAGAALSLASCSAAPAYTLAGSPLLDPQDTLDKADSRFASDVATDADVAIDDDARCYFLNVGETEIDSHVFCGPIAYVDASGPFRTYRIDSSHTDDGIRAAVGDITSSSGDIRDPSALTRPDGLQLPEELTIAPPPLAADTLRGVSQLPRTLNDDLDKTAFLTFPNSHSWVSDDDYLHVVVRAVERVSSLGGGYAQLTAAEGHELFIIDLADSGDAELTLLVNGNRRTLPDNYSTYLTSIPTGAEDLHLEARFSDVVQTVSLTDGTRGGEGKLLWYRATTSDRIGERYFEEVDVTGDGRSGTVSFTMTVERNYGDVRLAEYYRDAPAAPGKAHLIVEFEQRAYDDGPWDLDWTNGHNAVLELEDGTAFEGDSSRSSGSNIVAHFIVDEDFTGGTVTVESPVHWEIGFMENLYDRGTEQLPTFTFDIDIPLDTATP